MTAESTDDKEKAKSVSTTDGGRPPAVHAPFARRLPGRHAGAGRDAARFVV